LNTLPLIIILLGASVLGVAASRRLGLPPVLGYLLVGALIGPHALNFMGDVGNVRHLAEFGVVFLMFTIGLEFSLSRLFAMQRIVFGLGGAQVLLSMLLVGGLALVAGAQWPAAVTVAGALAMSSTAILVKLLSDRGVTDTNYGRQVIGVLLFQDLAVVPLLVLIPTLSQPPEQMAATMAVASLKAVVVLAVVLFVGHRVMANWLHFVARGRAPELFVLNVLLITLGLAYLTELAGLSLALGAFVAGILISETDYRHQVEEDIKPFRDVLLGLFFVTVGMQLDFTLIAHQWWWVAAGLVGLLAAKGVIVWALARMFGSGEGDALRSGLWLCAGGEFGFVLLAEAGRWQMVPPEMAQIVLAILVLSLFLAPMVVHYSERIVLRVVASEWLMRSMQLTRIATQAMSSERHTIICGFGRSGQHLARFLAQENVASVALDLDPDRVREAAAAGESVVFGDATRRESLIAAGVKRASAVVVTFGDVVAAEKVLAHVHDLRPELPVVVRALDESVLDRLYKAGAAEVVPEAIESSLMLASHALVLVGVPPRNVLQRIRELRRQRYHLLRGLFRGAAEDDGPSGEAPRLHSVVLAEGAFAIGRALGELGLPELGLEVSAIRRRGIRATQPGPEARFLVGDVVVLLGSPEALSAGEARLLRG
jgi:monovalent cation:H+ antiporter-2, CPA2 family